MMRSRRTIGIVIGVACTMVCAGCGRTSPIGPENVGPARAASVQAAAAPSEHRTLSNDLSTLGERAGEARFLVCVLGDGSQTQLSLTVWGMPGAALHCLNAMNGRVHGIVSAPAPPIP